MFNERVKVMNQTNSKQLILSAQEARNIQSDMFELLSYCTFMAKKMSQTSATDINVQMDGGGF